MKCKDPLYYLAKFSSLGVRRVHLKRHTFDSLKRLCEMSLNDSTNNRLYWYFLDEISFTLFLLYGPVTFYPPKD